MFPNPSGSKRASVTPPSSMQAKNPTVRQLANEAGVDVETARRLPSFLFPRPLLYILQHFFILIIQFSPNLLYILPIEKEHVDNSAAVRDMLLQRGILPENLPPAEGDIRYLLLWAFSGIDHFPDVRKAFIELSVYLHQ